MLEKEFRSVPEYPWLKVSRDGEVINLLTEDRTFGSCKEKVPNTKYLSAFSYHVHKLVALTWLERPDSDITLFTVNHKDGIKKNNVADNLEWVSYSDNSKHAYKSGLRVDNNPVLVKDLRDNNILDFYSISECARYFNKNPSLIHSYLKNSNVIRMNYYVFIRKGQDWPDLSKDDLYSDFKNKPRMLIGICQDSGKQIITNSVSEAEKLLEIRSGNLRMHLKRYGEKPYHGYIFKEIDNLELRDELLRQRWKVVGPPSCKRKPIPIIVHDVENNITRRFDSVEAFAQLNGTSKNTIQCSMIRNDGFWKKYKITYSPIQEKS